MDCIFCKIISKAIPVEAMIYESDFAVGVLDIHPIAPGHTMILPKVHAETILDLPDAALEGVFRAVKETTARLKEVLLPQGFTIGINHGRVSGQTIDHLHIHIIPRWENDGGKSIHSVVQNPPQESVEAMAKRIRNK